ncbi:MAG TPA: beta-lactamase family protein [Thermoanaerobacterales bacterium]|nr:beta-lactamase family protein [Thermoanaerobacterales bacterium]
MDHERLDYLKQYLKKKMNDAFPGTCFGIVTRDRVHTDFLGKAQIVPSVKEMKIDTIFDLASLTKVIATVTSIMILLGNGELRLSERVKAILPDFKYENITILHLLTHTSGLPADVKFYKFCNSREEVIDRLYDVSPIYKPGEKVIYSDLGFMLLGLVIEKLAEPVDRFASKHIFLPLEMSDTCYNPPAEKMARCAATEYQESRGVIVGKVHDGNAYAMGGASGHAGLFSTAPDLCNFMSMILNEGYFQGRKILSLRSIELMNRCYTDGLNERRGLGWQLKTFGDSIGELVGDNAMYHTGFTGTSMLIDRERGFGFVLLTNRVHPTRDNDKLLNYRGHINNIATTVIG